MYIHLFALLLLLIDQCTGQNFKCPTGFGLFTDPQSCTHYYECANFVPVSKVCGGGLYFNEPMKICDWPNSIDTSRCSSGTGNNVSGSTTSSNNNSPNSKPIRANSDHITFRCHADGLYEDPISCNHFVECSNFTPFRKNCPAGLHFDIRIKACNWPESMECKKNTNPIITRPPQSTTAQPYRPYETTTEYTGTYATPPSYEERPPNRGNEPSTSNNNQPITTTSPSRNDKGSSNVNANQQNCEWCFKCPNREDRYYENTYDKATYYHCFQGNAYLMYCPREMMWFDSQQNCVSQNAGSNNEKDQSIKPFSDDSSDDGAGLIDARMKVRNNKPKLSTSKPTTPSTSKPSTPLTSKPKTASTSKPKTSSTTKPQTPSTSIPKTPSTTRSNTNKPSI